MRQALAAALAGVAAALAGVAAACVLPDRGIIINDRSVVNKHPLRFVEPTPVTNEAANACLQVLLDNNQTNAVCQPGDPETVLPHFLDPDFEDGGIFPYRFCSCDAQQTDKRKLPAVTLYVEDRRNETDAELTLYAALQLDLRPDESEPQQAVEYISYVDPTAPLEPVDALKYEPPRRPDGEAGRKLFALNLGLAEDSERIDLCNGAGTTPLARGYHTLRIIVTDAAWYQPTSKDVQQFGVPDLAKGATYDTLTYIFHCDDKTADADNHCDQRCGQQEPE